jgi:hypothetical protein
MLLPFLFLASIGWTADVMSFPSRPHHEVRRAAREVLGARRRWHRDDLVNAMRTGPVAAARIVLEEVNASLALPRRVIPRATVEDTLKVLLQLPEVAATGPERGALRAELDPLIAGATASNRLEPALGLAVHFKTWEPGDVRAIDLAHARRAFLQHWYFLIAASAPWLEPAALDEMARELLANESDPLLRFGLLDEIGRLPSTLDAMTLRLLRLEFVPHAQRVISSEARIIHFRMLDRWQARVRAHEPRALAAVQQLSLEPTDAAGRAFARGLASGQLTSAPNERMLRAADPLRLACGARLVDVSYK